MRRGIVLVAEQGINQSVERAVVVLRAFAAGRSELRVSDVARLAGLGISTTSRLLTTLEAQEFLERDPVSNLYRLGPGLITLGGIAVNHHPVHRAARQSTQQLACDLGLGANVAVRRDAALFYLCNFDGSLAPKSYTLMGQGNPLHATGLGKCLLSALTSAERRQLLPASFQVFTEFTIESHERLNEEIAMLGRRGYALEVEELALGRACVAAPIRDATGEVVAALSVSGSLSVIDLPDREEQLARRVIEAADHISVSLGYMGPVHYLPSA